MWMTANFKWNRKHYMSKSYTLYIFVCVRACVREREREKFVNLNWLKFDWSPVQINLSCIPGPCSINTDAIFRYLTGSPALSFSLFPSVLPARGPLRVFSIWIDLGVLWDEIHCAHVFSDCVHPPLLRSSSRSAASRIKSEGWSWHWILLSVHDVSLPP